MKQNREIYILSSALLQHTVSNPHPTRMTFAFGGRAGGNMGDWEGERTDGRTDGELACVICADRVMLYRSEEKKM
jgi:hypothetical protein